ncbi:MAG: hypothetical protein GX638_01790, partial [Crenarchaeota archaeon]|nr:hypothetical protein [Thermoproteota archaeon]
QTAQTRLNKIGRKHCRRIFVSILQSTEASSRLAHLDVEKYGIAKVNFSGSRDKPFYSTTRRLQLQPGNFASIPSEQLDREYKLRKLNSGGSLTVIEMNGIEQKPEELMKLTIHLMESQKIELLTYYHTITYCKNCDKSWIEKLNKCPSCGSIGSLSVFDRFYAA